MATTIQNSVERLDLLKAARPLDSRGRIWTVLYRVQQIAARVIGVLGLIAQFVTLPFAPAIGLIPVTLAAGALECGSSVCHDWATAAIQHANLYYAVHNLKDPSQNFPQTRAFEQYFKNAFDELRPEVHELLHPSLEKTPSQRANEIAEGYTKLEGELLPLALESIAFRRLRENAAEDLNSLEFGQISKLPFTSRGPLLCAEGYDTYLTLPGSRILTVSQLRDCPTVDAIYNLIFPQVPPDAPLPLPEIAPQRPSFLDRFLRLVPIIS